VTPSSNLTFGAVDRLSEVPLAALRAAGLRVGLSADDPPLVGITLPREHALLRSDYGLGEADAAMVEANAFRNAFAAQAMAVAS
jgi:adenosine deaminase